MTQQESPNDRFRRFLADRPNLTIDSRSEQFTQDIVPILEDVDESLKNELFTLLLDERKDDFDKTLMPNLYDRLMQLRNGADLVDEVFTEVQLASAQGERFRIFVEQIAPLFGKADEVTLAFYERCKELGVECMMPMHDANGNYLTQEQEIAFLELPETQKILKNPRKYMDA